MRYEYKLCNVRGEIEAIRRSDKPRHDIPDHEFHLQILNREGRDGWRSLNPSDTHAVFFERQIEEDFISSTGEKASLKKK